MNMGEAKKNTRRGFRRWGTGFGDLECPIPVAPLPKPEAPYPAALPLTPKPRPAAAVLTILALLISLGAPAPRISAALSLEAKQAVEKGLDHLAKTQGSDGSWPDHYGKSPAVVGLAALAFMAHGDMPGRGKYKDTLERAIDYILKHSQENGLIARPGSQPMYDHGFATLALAEAYGMCKRKDLEVALLRAVRLIERVQNLRGGWRYQPRPADDDITVTGCQLMALRAARNAGVNVQSIVIRKGLDYIKSCVCPDGGFAYQPGGSSGKARTGIGILLLELLGESESPLVVKGAEYLTQNPLRPGETYYYYGLYYCTQAMFQKGGEHWQSWRKAVLDTVVSTQNDDGSWPKQGSEGGDTYAVAMALLALEVEWKLLPIYER